MIAIITTGLLIATADIILLNQKLEQEGIVVIEAPQDPSPREMRLDFEAYAPMRECESHELSIVTRSYTTIGTSGRAPCHEIGITSPFG